MRYNELGEELPDPTPVALPVPIKRPPTIQELYMKLVENPRLKEALGRVDLETEEEAEDLDVEDEMPDPVPAAAKAFGLDEEIAVAAAETRAGFRAKKDVADIYRKARKEHEENVRKKSEPKPEGGSDAKS